MTKYKNKYSTKNQSNELNFNANSSKKKNNNNDAINETQKK
jgi:hypothetical protein